MKRTNPIVLRLGLSKNWDNNINVLNYKETIPFLLKTGTFVQNFFCAFVWKKPSFFIPLQTSSVVSDRTFYLNFFYCFLNHVVFFEKKNL